jgi:hypothetical protein
MTTLAAIVLADHRLRASAELEQPSTGRAPLASLALDPTTHHTYFPIPKGPKGSPVLWEFQPTT